MAYNYIGDNFPCRATNGDYRTVFQRSVFMKLIAIFEIIMFLWWFFFFFFTSATANVVQATGSYPEGRGFEPRIRQVFFLKKIFTKRRKIQGIKKVRTRGLLNEGSAHFHLFLMYDDIAQEFFFGLSIKTLCPKILLQS